MKYIYLCSSPPPIVRREELEDCTAEFSAPVLAWVPAKKAWMVLEYHTEDGEAFWEPEEADGRRYEPEFWTELPPEPKEEMKWNVS